MKPMFGLQKNEHGDVVAAGNFRDSYDLGNWIKGLDIRSGDFIEFRETAKRPEDEPDYRPAFLNEDATQPKTPELVESDDEQPF